MKSGPFDTHTFINLDRIIPFIYKARFFLDNKHSKALLNLSQCKTLLRHPGQPELFACIETPLLFAIVFSH
jgi:hypothetical protein